MLAVQKNSGHKYPDRDIFDRNKMPLPQMGCCAEFARSSSYGINVPTGPVYVRTLGPRLFAIRGAADLQHNIHSTPVMWALRPSVLGQDRSETPKKPVLVLVLQFWCCFVKHDLVTLVVIMILKDTTTL